jgi:energy-coupling factor transporter ATP-binding protein EcfA2
MKLQTPHIITEGNVQYQLGELNGNHILYDYDKILIYLQVKGKLLFGHSFEIYEEDRNTIFKLCSYMIRDHETCKKMDIDLNKGILLTGPVGCGKTSIMKLIRGITPLYPSYDIIPSRNVTFAFNHIGYRIIEQYGDHKFYCFDDLGIEPYGKHFGKECNVMGEVLLSRYDLFVHYKFKTHGTTNLNANELEAYYGNRVRSRMRQLFNLIAYDKESHDKRQ